MIGITDKVMIDVTPKNTWSIPDIRLSLNTK